MKKIPTVATPVSLKKAAINLKKATLLPAINLLHSVSLKITNFGIWISDTGASLGERLWETGGRLECWCDETAWEMGARSGLYGAGVPMFAPDDLAMPVMPREIDRLAQVYDHKGDGGTDD